VPNTIRMSWPYPSENQDPFYEAFEALMAAVDASAYAGREDRNIALMGGGTVSWSIVPLTDVATLIWTAPLEVLSPNVGFRHNILAGSLALSDGQLVYCSLTRAPTSNLTTVVLLASSIPPTADGDSWFVLGIRRGSRFYWRNGKVLNDGDSLEVLQTNGAGFGIAGNVVRFQIPVVLNEATDQAAYQAVGNYWFDPAEWAVAGLTTTVVFRVIGFVTAPGLLGDILVRDLLGAVDLAVVPFTGPGDTAPTHKQVALPATAAQMEFRVRVAGGIPPIDRFICRWAAIEVQQTVA